MVTDCQFVFSSRCWKFLPPPQLPLLMSLRCRLKSKSSRSLLVHRRLLLWLNLLIRDRWVFYSFFLHSFKTFNVDLCWQYFFCLQHITMIFPNNYVGDVENVQTVIVEVMWRIIFFSYHSSRTCLTLGLYLAESSSGIRSSAFADF